MYHLLKKRTRSINKQINKISLLDSEDYAWVTRSLFHTFEISCSCTFQSTSLVTSQYLKSFRLSTDTKDRGR